MSCSDGLHHTPSFSSLAGQHNIACATVAKVLSQATPGIKQDILDQVDLRQYIIPVKKNFFETVSSPGQSVGSNDAVKFDKGFIVETEKFNETTIDRISSEIPINTEVSAEGWKVASVPFSKVRLPQSGMYEVGFRLDNVESNIPTDWVLVRDDPVTNIVDEEMFPLGGIINSFFHMGTSISVVNRSKTSQTLEALLFISQKTMSVADATNEIIKKLTQVATAQSSGGR